MRSSDEVGTAAIGTVDFEGARVYAIPMRVRFRGITVREGMLIEGPAGWGEFCPFAEYDDAECAPLGGVRRSLQVAAAARLPCVVSSALETSVGLAAQLALAAALTELDFACGLGTLSLLDGDLVAGSGSLLAVEGYLPIPDKRPAPDPALLEKYELTDPQRAAWWRDRLRRVRALPQAELQRAQL